MRTFSALLIALAWWLLLSTAMLGQQEFVQSDPNNGLEQIAAQLKGRNLKLNLEIKCPE